MTADPALIEGFVVASESLSPDVRRVVVSTSAPYPFRAGQHVALRFEGEGPLDSYYSYASAARTEAPYEFELAVGRGTGERPPEVPIGARIVISSPRGAGMLERIPPARSLLLVATGTGVAPLRALIEEAHRLEVAVPVRLLHGCRTEADRLFAAQFEALAERGWLGYFPVLSRPSAGWRGLVGHVQDHLARVLVDRPVCAVCGSMTMVEDVTRLLLEQGVDAVDIFAEGY